MKNQVENKLQLQQQGRGGHQLPALRHETGKTLHELLTTRAHSPSRTEQRLIRCQAVSALWNGMIFRPPLIDISFTDTKLLIMAEIRVQAKKQASVWPWILIAILVIGALVYFMTRNKEQDTHDAGSQTQTTTGFIPVPANHWSKMITVGA